MEVTTVNPVIEPIQVQEAPRVEQKRQEPKGIADQIDISSEQFVANAKKNDKNGKDSKFDFSNVSDVLDKAISDANKILLGYNRQFEYSVHEVTNDVMIKIIDSDTKEVLKEIPPKKNLDAIAKMWELAGIIVDEKR